MRFLSFWRGLPKDGLHAGAIVKVLDYSGDTVEATLERNVGRRVVVTYMQGRYTGMGQYVKRERIVGKQAEPAFAHHRGWDQMKEARGQIDAAALFTLLVVGPASLIADIAFLVSNSGVMSSIIFLSVLAIDLFAAVHWLRRQPARQEQGTNPLPKAHMTVHEFIAHSRMHPELLPAGVTEFDLERFRKAWSEKESQAAFGDWMRQLINSATV
jgi:membrane protein implicated in regulation of membrane protease activity